jgi:ATP synthase protein I
MANGSDRKGTDGRDADLENRLKNLDGALERHRDVRQGDEAADEARSEQAAGFANALRLSSEFIAGVVVGAGLGWFIDRAFGTSPWGLIVFLLLGFCAGVLNVLRSAGLVAQKKDLGAPDGGQNNGGDTGRK